MSIKERIVNTITNKQCMTVKKISHLVSQPRSVVREILQQLIENKQIVKYHSTFIRTKEDEKYTEEHFMRYLVKFFTHFVKKMN